MYIGPTMTTTMADEDLSKLHSSLHKAFIDKTVLNSGYPEPSEQLYLVTSLVDDVREFTHPITMNIDGQAIVFVDVRSCTRRQDSPWEEIKPSNGTEFGFAILRGRLELSREYGETEWLQPAASIPGRVYSQWIKGNLGRTFNLGIEEQISVAVISALRWHLLNFKVSNPEDNEWLENASYRIFKYTMVNPDVVMSILDKVQEPHLCVTTEGFVTALKEACDGVKLDKLNWGSVITASLHGWYGTGSRSICAAALESVTTFHALCVAGTDRAYGKTAIGQILKQIERKDRQAVEGYVKTVVNNTKV